MRSARRAVLSKNKVRAPTVPGSGGVRDIMSLRGDNGGLQRNRWPDRAHGRRGTYDLRRNNPRPCPDYSPLIRPGVAAVGFLVRATLIHVNRYAASCRNHSVSL